MTILTRRFRLRGVHFLYDPVHVEPKHGHEYWLQVSVQAQAGRDVLEEVVQREILESWDGGDWTEMGLQQATGELLVEKFDEILRNSKIGKFLEAVVLRETRKNRFISAKSALAHCE